jgi:hypothetical protein
VRALALLPLALASACARPSTDVLAETSSVSVSAPVSVSVSVSVSPPPTADASDASATTPTRFDPSEWEPAQGHWSFLDGELVSDGKAMSALVYRRGERPRDFDFTVEVKFETNESSAGILFREVGDDFYKDATFYQFEWYTHGSHHDRRLSLMKKNPYWVQLVEPRYPEAPLDAWITLRVRAEGDFVQTFVDGVAVFSKHDPTFVRAGRLGLHCFMPRRVRFRRPVVRVW